MWIRRAAPAVSWNRITDRDRSWRPRAQDSARFRDGSGRHRMLGLMTHTTREPRDQLPAYVPGRPWQALGPGG